MIIASKVLLFAGCVEMPVLPWLSPLAGGCSVRSSGTAPGSGDVHRCISCAGSECGVKQARRLGEYKHPAPLCLSLQAAPAQMIPATSLACAAN